ESKMTNALADALQFKPSFEKVEGIHYMVNFDADCQRWIFHLQFYFLAERFMEQKRIFEYRGGYIQVRSIYDDMSFFASMHYDNGTMSEMDYETYTGLFEPMVMTSYFPPPDLLIYLEGTLDDVLGRIQTRGREMEKNTPISYWEEMYDRYDDWINDFHACPIL